MDYQITADLDRAITILVIYPVYQTNNDYQCLDRDQTNFNFKLRFDNTSVWKEETQDSSTMMKVYTVE